MKASRFFLLLTLFSCQKDQSDCQELARREPGPCWNILMPVCGCNGKTYGNECEASRYGITRYTPGECKK